MERLQHPPQPYLPAALSPPKYISSSEPAAAAGGKRDSAFSCFSGGSGTLVHDSSAAGRKGTNAENIFFKGLQGDRPQQSDRHKFLQPGVGSTWDGSRTEEQPTFRVSIAGRPSIGQVWQVPEKKTSQSPPPPAPPQRSDSFAATKVFPYPEGRSGPANSHGRSFEKLTESSHSCFRPQTFSQLHQNKLFSLSSSDVSHPAQPPSHQRQYSDESPFYLQARAAPSTQSVGSYYRSLQDLPANAFGRKHVRHSTASTAVNPASEGGGRNRYYSLAGKHPVQTPEKARQGKTEGWRGETDKLQRPSSSGAGLQGSVPQMLHAESKERRGGALHGNSLPCEPLTYDLSLQKREGHSHVTKRFHRSLAHGGPRHKDPWVPQDDRRISPLNTPLLHSLSQESRSLAERPPASTASAPSTQDAVATSSGKASRRGDRYATTLRKEIQQKRAQLQKSRSAATLTCDPEDEEADDWRASSNSYKDHLKEAQARVLQATSFQRRDLEPLTPEGPALKASGRVRGRRRFHPAKRTHSFSEPDKMDKVGVEGSEERRKLSEDKPARPTLKTGHEEDNEDAPADLLSPGPEQQRLGTFAEYQATWTRQKKPSETRTQGRFHSAENILDAGAEEKTTCVHERSRSSPSADFCSQKIPPAWKDLQLSTFTSSETTESRSPDPGPPPPAQGVVDHRSKSDPAGPPQTALCGGRRSASPRQPTQSLRLPPRPLLGPPTTSSSQEFLAGTQSDPTALPLPSSLSSDTQRHTAAHVSSSGPTLAGSPRRGVMSEVAADSQEEREQPAPPSSSPSSGLAAGLPLPGSDRARSPSPQFSPLRLTDKPPAASAEDESRFRSGDKLQPSAVMEVGSSVRKVPVKIVRAETSSDRQGPAYLPQVTETCCVPEPPPHVPSPGAPDHHASSLFSAYTRPAPQDLGGASAPGQESKSTGASEEDAKREELARDIMGKDKSLVDILDQSGRKTTMDLMEGLFPPEEKILEGNQQRRRASAGSRLPSSSSRSSERREEEEASSSAAASLVPSSSYYSTSAPKAELLIKMKDMQEQLEEQDPEDELDVDLASKKQELIFSLARKLEVLREARQSLQEDVQDNEALGRDVEDTVQRRCRPNQLDKFRMFVGDLDKVVSLLLSLSGRLARVENALNSLEDEAPLEEKRTLTEKRKLLMRQHEDAKELKENLDRREQLVSGIMEAHLDGESLDDYRHFVKMKAALIIEQRKLEDKIKLGEEQLKCLKDSLPLEQRSPP